MPVADPDIETRLFHLRSACYLQRALECQYGLPHRRNLKGIINDARISGRFDVSDIEMMVKVASKANEARHRKFTSIPKRDGEWRIESAASTHLDEPDTPRRTFIPAVDSIDESPLPRAELAKIASLEEQLQFCNNELQMALQDLSAALEAQSSLQCWLSARNVELQDMIARNSALAQELNMKSCELNDSEHELQSTRRQLARARGQHAAMSDEIDHLRSVKQLACDTAQSRLATVSRQHEDDMRSVQQQLVETHSTYQLDRASMAREAQNLVAEVAEVKNTCKKLEQIVVLSRENETLRADIKILEHQASSQNMYTVTDVSSSFGCDDLAFGRVDSSSTLLTWLDPSTKQVSVSAHTDYMADQYMNTGRREMITKFTQTKKWRLELPTSFMHGAIEKVVQVSVAMVTRATSTETLPAPIHTQILAAIKIQKAWRNKPPPSCPRYCACCGNQEDDVGKLSILDRMMFCPYCLPDQIAQEHEEIDSSLVSIDGEDIFY
eukprot:gnl/MRDRNA2_/MRDRNA2_102526_c0_seq1.p1 gnl/MRDRNA2_/MRDRNA2_102526_c0~~gnl/MRDRNA2_/MRDRNA2_102526_c0_seq1.p1  ORF type:complete len:566 (-),score=110.54 gnl/MRDRNA2_/MRDRNA2_102526_c0_seq1:14-1504(-)